MKNNTYKEEIENLLKKESKINVIECFKENYLSLFLIYIVIFILSYDNFFLGIITFYFILYLSYNDHKSAHKIRNIFSIIHCYHHENNNFFSHFIQILLEISLVGIFTPLYYIFGTIFFNPWVLLFFILFYSSVHNINYSYLHINNVHKLHHEFYNTNIGPDILDIIFETKHPSEDTVENTNHYIPNIIITFLFVIFLKYLWNIDNNKKRMLLLLNYFLFISFSILISTAIYLTYIKY